MVLGLLLAAVPLGASPLAPTTLKWAILGILAPLVAFLWLVGGCGRPFRPLPSLFFPLLALLLLSELSLLQAVNLHYGLQRVTALLMLCLVYLTVAYTGTSREVRERLVRTLALTLLGVSLLSFTACALADAEMFRPAAGTLFVLFGNTNYGAAYLLTALPVALGLYVAASQRMEAVVWGTAVVFSGALLTLSMVRGAWVSIWFGFGLLAWVMARRGDQPGVIRPAPDRVPGLGEWRRVLGPLLLIGAAMALAGILRPLCLPGGASFGERVASLVDPSTDSLQIRLSVWGGTVRLIRDHLWTGVGAGNFPLAFVPYRAAAIYQNPGMQVEHPHNEVLHAMAELGPLGLVVLLWLLAGVGRLGWRLARRADREKAVVGGVLGGLAAAAVYANLFYVVNVPASAMNVAALLGLLDAMDHDSGGEARGPRVRARVLLPAMLVIGVLAVPYFVQPLAGEVHYSLAEREFQSGRMEAGLSRLDRSLAWYPHSHLVRYRRAFVLFAMDRYAETIQEAQAVLRIHPKMEVAYGVMGSAYLKLGDTKTARDIFEHALAVNPNYPHALNNLGVLAAREGRIAEAEKMFLRAGEVLGRREMSPYANLANVYEVSGRLPEALRMMETAVAIDPRVGANWYHLARLRILTGDLSTAAEALARAAALDEAWRIKALDDPAFQILREREPRVRNLLEME